MKARQQEKKGGMQGFIAATERVTRHIPDPLKMFLWLIMIVGFISFVVSLTGKVWIHPTTGQEIAANNFFSKAGLQWLLSNLVTNFTGYVAFGPAIVMMMAVGICEETGVMSTLMKRATKSVSAKLLPLFFCFIGLISTIADSTAIFVLPPLAGFAYLAIGRNPMLGMITVYLCNTVGTSANILLTNCDVMCAGITNAVAEQVAIEGISPVSNWYFMATSCIILTFVIWMVTEKMLSKALPPLSAETCGIVNKQEGHDEVSPGERRAMNHALIALAIFIALCILGIATGVLQDDSGIRFFWNSLVSIMFFGFLVFGLTYGFSMKSIKSVEDVRRMAIKAVTRTSGYIVIVFVMSQFTSILNYTNLTRILAISGTNFLKSVNFVGLGMVITFILISAVINIFMTSTTAKWSIFAPIIVPIFSALGWSPAFAQAAYRISDAATNSMSPISPFLYMMVDIAKDTFECKDATAQKWLSLLIPASAICLLAWVLILVAWVLLGLPLGPDAVIHM